MTTKPLRIVVAVNPSAAFGAHAGTGPAVLKRLRSEGHDATELRADSFDLLLDVSREAVSAAPDAFVVVGGDGMVNLGVNAVATTGVPLGIVPSGTGNDMARGLGIPIGRLNAAIATLIDHLGRPARTIDAGLITSPGGDTRWFACVLSGGFDAVVTERANSMRRPRGRSRFTFAMLRELATLRPIRYDLEIDGVSTSVDAILIAVANNTSFGGGMRLAPAAELDDGLFDVATLAPVNRRQLLGIFPKVFSGAHVHDPRVSIRRARTVVIDAPGVIAYADGERIGPLPLTVQVMPGALAVLA